MSNVETAIEEMIQSYIDEQDSNAEQHTDQCVSDLEDQIADVIVNMEELQNLESRITSLELILERFTRQDGEPLMKPAENLLQELADAAEEHDENLFQALADSAPRSVNQIDWIMTPNNIIAGYGNKAMLESYVRSCLDNPNQAEMVIAMVLTTARNLINDKLEAES